MDSELKKQWELPIHEVRLGKLLKTGGEGSVYEGTFRNETVAIKVVKKVEQIKIDHLKGLSHPNVVGILGVCRQPPRFYIVMELCPNGSLYEVIHDAEFMLCPRMVAVWLKQIAHGMEYLHGRNLLHCDLKSPNILIGQKNEAKITDFGSCQIIGVKATHKRVACTARWMSPELIRSKTHTFGTDVWAYGVVAWEMIMRQIPYEHLEKNEVLRQLSRYELALPLPDGIPERLRQLIESCQRINANRRPMFHQVTHLVDEAAEDLKEFTPETFYKAQLQWQNMIE